MADHTNGMTADVYPFDAGFLARVAGRIVNEVRGINRVTYDITSKPPGTIEWELILRSGSPVLRWQTALALCGVRFSSASCFRLGGAAFSR